MTKEQEQRFPILCNDTDSATANATFCNNLIQMAIKVGYTIYILCKLVNIWKYTITVYFVVVILTGN